MGWALQYKIKLGRELTPDETRSLEEWSAASPFPLEPVLRDLKAFYAYRGLIPAEQFDKLKRQYEADLARNKHNDCDYKGSIQLRSEARFRKVVDRFKALAAILPFADIRLTDDYSLSDADPREIDLALPRPVPQPAVKVIEDAAEGAVKKAEPGDDLEERLARARADFALWKSRSTQS